MYSPLKLGPEMPNKSLNRPCRSITQRTDCMPLNLLGYFLQLVNFLKLCVSNFHPFHHVPQPWRPFSAGCALAATLMLVEVGQSGNRIHHICRLVHYNNGCSSKTRLHCFQRIEIHEDIITDMLGKERYR
ncbi:hypothetical protein Mapa_000618 [Marchantia paleacea]|nr:hypothetical protein Mapa_000618 [Marchantia paleacea]